MNSAFIISLHVRAEGSFLVGITNLSLRPIANWTQIVQLLADHVYFVM